MNKNTWIIVVVVVGILAAGGGFAGGVLYQKGQSTTPSGTTGFAGLTPQQRQQFRQGLGGRFARGGAVVGTVASSDSTSLTVKSTNGSTTTVYINGNTKYLLETSGQASDVTTGKSVTISGMPNSDGSITATTVRVQQ